MATDKHAYNSSGIRAECASLDMQVDEDALDVYRALCAKHEVSQAAFDELGRYHAQTVKSYFTPSNYGFWSRVKIALYFLKG